MTPVTVAKKKRDFDLHAFLATIGEGRKFVQFPKKQTIFSQGDNADAVFYVQTGKVKLTVVSKTGKEATIGILGEGDFFGEGSLAGRFPRWGPPPPLRDSSILQIEKNSRVKAFHR